MNPYSFFFFVQNNSISHLELWSHIQGVQHCVMIRLQSERQNASDCLDATLLQHCPCCCGSITNRFVQYIYILFSIGQKYDIYKGGKNNNNFFWQKKYHTKKNACRRFFLSSLLSSLFFFFFKKVQHK